MHRLGLGGFLNAWLYSNPNAHLGISPHWRTAEESAGRNCALLISLSEETPYTPYLTSGDISICPFNQIPLAQWTDGMVTKVFLKRFDMCATKAGVIHVILELFCIVLADASAPDKTQAKEYIIFFSSPLSYFFFNYYLIKREMQYCNYF